MHTSRDELPAQAFGEYEGRMADFGEWRVAIVRAGEAYSLAPGHFVQTLEPVELVEFSPRAEHDRAMETIAGNLAAVAS